MNNSSNGFKPQGAPVLKKAAAPADPKKKWMRRI